MNLAVEPSAKGSWAAANLGGGPPPAPTGPRAGPRAEDRGGRTPEGWAVSEQLQVYERLIQVAHSTVHLNKCVFLQSDSKCVENESVNMSDSKLHSE